ncbi:DUF1015 domain-containing protein [Paratissierella segnis]|jgi:uncharacterized protein (DUF1015 family)|uniref:DUF1015 domain-containing protein n=1 Tax=Paratissierella segnis TaxID=2763679 RepID=A0A926EQS3_9FIRM|nr:DUF1015 family protein [Paratissierella segnis]MBC8588018.1 DUF1015 domain-containing protein [Paratissierella segnis]
MVNIRTFKAVRPRHDLTEKVAALPYDVLSSEEAKELVKDNPYSFLHIDKAEIDLEEDIDIYDERVYKKAKENLDTFIEKSILDKDKKESLYIYEQKMNENKQTGLVACASIDDYIENKIKKHEFTREDKEIDRIKHVDTTNANTGPIFLTYPYKMEIIKVIEDYKKNNTTIFDFISDDGVAHIGWKIEEDEIIEKLINLFKNVDSLYIADGHHRAASAVKVGLNRRNANPHYTGNEEFNYFLAVLFPSNQLEIMDYNRVVKDLNGYKSEEFLKKISENFIVEEYMGDGSFKPREKHEFGMYLDTKWYILTAKENLIDEKNPLKGLDVSILQDYLLDPILGITDPRTCDRIDFIGGIRGLGELENRVDEGMRAAFSMYPTSINDLIDIADKGEVMPPKSTWFEPKLRSGLFIHELD